MASTKSNGERNFMKAVSKSAYSGSRASVKSRTLKSVRSQRMIKNAAKNDTKTIKSVKTVKTIDIVNLINGAKLSDKIQPNLATEEDKEKDEEENELVYLD